MNLKKYNWCFAFIFCLSVTGAFSLLWMRQKIYLQASKTRLLERELATLETLDKRADTFLGMLQSKTTHLTPALPQQIIWVSTSSESKTHTVVASL